MAIVIAEVLTNTVYDRHAEERTGINAILDVFLPAQRYIVAIATVFLWIKLLYFMRVFRGTGFYIRVITEVTIDLRDFLLIFLISILAFSDAMLTMSMGNIEEH